MFIWEGQRYLVIGDTVLKRHSKYKSTAEYCSAPLEYWVKERKEVGRDDLDRPIIVEEWVMKRKEYAVQRKETNISIDENQAINLFNYRYEFKIRDIIENAETYTTNQAIVRDTQYYRHKRIYAFCSFIIKWRIASRFHSVNYHGCSYFLFC